LPALLSSSNNFEIGSSQAPALDWLYEPKSRRITPHRLEDCGYLRVNNPDNIQGLWTVKGKRCAVYARKELSAADRLRAARACI
jgi:hypothetical protein